MSQAILFNFYTLNVMILIRKDDHCAVLMSQLSNKRLLMLMLSAFSYLICSETFYTLLIYSLGNTSLHLLHYIWAFAASPEMYFFM